MNTKSTLNIVAQVGRKTVERDIAVFTDAEWMEYINMPERAFNAAEVVAILDVNRTVVEARRIVGRNDDGTFKLAKDSNAFGLEGWTLADVEGMDRVWMEHPRATITLIAALGRDGLFNGNVDLFNYNEADRAAKAAEKAAAAKAEKAAKAAAKTSKATTKTTKAA